MPKECTVMTEKMVRNLDEAFMMGMSDREACMYCGLSYSTFTTWLEKNEEYRTKKESLKQYPKLLVKRNLAEAIKNKDIDTSKWYAERKMKDEGFNAKQEIDLTSNITLMTIQSAPSELESEE